MAVNKNALIRYKTIDKCLQNHYRTWTLEDLIYECSEALYEYEGIDKGVSKRTVQSDIQMMRSDKLGYNAPIIVIDKKYYTYEDKDYSITNIPISDQDLNKLNEAVEFLKQFKGFSHFKELDGMVQKLEDHVYSQKTNQQPVIDLEKNENLKGLEFLEELYQAIIKKETLEITYQSFKARSANSFQFHPYLLKEFRNRWFLIGKKNSDSGIVNLALDRILNLKKGSVTFIEEDNFNPATFYQHTIGVSVSPNEEPDYIELFITHKHAPYVLTKPFHSSQKVISKDYYGVTISLNVHHNFELEKDILGLGDGIRVIKPQRLRQNIQQRLNGALDLYKTVINKRALETRIGQLNHKGYSVQNNIYTKREVNKICNEVYKYFQNKTVKYAIRNLLNEIPNLRELLFNKNLLTFIENIDSNAFLTKAIFFNKTQNENWYVTNHQDITINLKSKQETEGYSGWTEKEGTISVIPPIELLKNCFTIRIHLDDTDSRNGVLKVIPGSHTKIHLPEDITTITENSVPISCNVELGGINLMKPLTIHSSSKSEGKKQRRVIHLEFSSDKLPEGLEWAEKEEINYI